jgi:hypothetical protein
MLHGTMPHHFKPEPEQTRAVLCLCCRASKRKNTARGGVGLKADNTAGFILDPEGRREVFSYRRARNYRQEVGQAAWTFPQTTKSQWPFSERKSESTLARAHRGLVSANEKTEKQKKRKF